MKIFAAYCLLILLSGTTLLAPLQEFSFENGWGKKISRILQQVSGLTTGKHECCTTKNNKSAKEHSCNTGQKDPKSCGQTDCTRTCCSSITGFIANGFSIQGPLPGVLMPYPLLVSSKLPAPFLGKLTPPPNFC